MLWDSSIKAAWEGALFTPLASISSIILSFLPLTWQRGPCPQLPVDGSVRPSEFPHTWLLNKYPNFIPLRVKNRYQMIWDTPLRQRVSVHTITFNWSNASSRFQSRSIPARCQLLLLELEILSFFNRARLESSKTGWPHPWESDQWLYQAQTSDAAIQIYFASGTLKQMCSLGSQVFEVETLALG